MVTYAIWMLIAGTRKLSSARQDRFPEAAAATVPGRVMHGLQMMSRLLGDIRWPGQRAGAFHLYREGKAALDRNDFDLALCYFSEVIRTDRWFAAGHCGRGFTHLKKGNCEQAIADFSEAIRLAPRNADCCYYRSLCYEVRGDNDRAIADQVQAFRLDPHVAERVEGWRRPHS